jgi:ComF family protein
MREVLARLNGLSGLARLAGRALAPFLLDEARCPACGAAWRREAGGAGSLCPACRESLEEPGEARRGAACPGCGAWPPMPNDTPLLCGQCLRQPRPWNRMVAAGPYEGRLRAMILAYKFEGRLDLGRRLQELLLAAFERGVADFPELAGCGVVVPVPLHPRRLLSRGFNQSREAARLLSARRGLPMVQEALCRVRRTVPQMELGAAERVENIRGAFAADTGLVAGRNVLLVDDIMTTGATLEECARTLTRAGAARVDVIVLARA